MERETLESKLRNQLNPIYGLADMVLGLEDDIDNTELLKIVIESAKRVIKNKEEIDDILNSLGNQRKEGKIMFPSEADVSSYKMGVDYGPVDDIIEWYKQEIIKLNKDRV